MKHRSILSLIIVIILCLGCVTAPIHAANLPCGGNHVYECVGNGTHYVTPNQYFCNWQQMVHCTHVCSCGATQLLPHMMFRGQFIMDILFLSLIGRMEHITSVFIVIMK